MDSFDIKTFYGCILTALSAIGSAIASYFGGWSGDITTLCIFMIVDYVTGVYIAAVLKKSEKSENGGLSSKAGWKGLAKKCLILLFVMIAYRLDLLLNVDFVRTGVIIGFCLNELVSIIENAGIIGLPLPKPIIKAIDMLKSKTDKE